MLFWRPVLLAVVLALSACETEPPPGRLYFDRVIQPILTESCARGSGGCHSVTLGDEYAFANGNLDVTSFESLHKRPDLLRSFGPYPAPMLLLKAVADTKGTDDLQVLYGDAALPSRIPHAGGSVLKVSSPAFLTLQQWLADGATRNGVKPPTGPIAGAGECSTTVPPDFDPASVTSTPAWAAHSGEIDAVRDVVIRHGCAAATCHGAPSSDFYFTCGSDLANRAFDFRQIQAFVAKAVDRSPILVAPSLGSTHTGGIYFQSTTDPDYVTLHDFAASVGALGFGAGDPGRTFFAEEVMPVLFQRGCAAEGCHSPAAMNDFKLRSGTGGQVSAIALERNYTTTRNELMAIELPDPRRGRLIAKNVFPAHGGIGHRGGPLLEFGAGADPATCAATYDPATASPFCTLAEWARIERQSLGNPNGGASIPLIYVERQETHLAGPLEATVYQPGSDLLVRDATLGAGGSITGVGPSRSLLGGCAGAGDRNAVDVRGPDVKNDGQTVAFAMRTGSSDTLHLYTVRVDGSACTRITSDPGVFDFDPAWSPDGGTAIVFASTRVAAQTRRTRLPQSDIWRMRPDGTGAEQMTFLSNSEVSPQFMHDGRVIMSAEKVDASDPDSGFYQISGRRLNWDLTDYHPLLAQRRLSPNDPMDPSHLVPSIGYQQATEIREAPDGTFLLVLSDAGARGGAGTIGVFNRSIGPVEAGRQDAGYLRSLTVPDPSAGGAHAIGAWRSPFPLPDGKILASHVSASADMTAVGALDWDLVALDPHTGEVTPILTAPGAQVEAVLALVQPERPLFLNSRQLIFGGGQDKSDPTHAFVYVTDAPMIGTLLGANLRRGRFIDELAGADHLDIYDASGAPVTSVPLAADGSLRLRVPAAMPFYLGLSKGTTRLFRMTEEHQFGPGEHISLGVRREVFNHVCGGCHGSVSGRETDVAVSADALTGASASLSHDTAPVIVGP